jgi:hypothetical protein
MKEVDQVLVELNLNILTRKAQNLTIMTTYNIVKNIENDQNLTLIN